MVTIVNKRAGTCDGCGADVAVGAGHAIKPNGGGAWTLHCQECHANPPADTTTAVDFTPTGEQARCLELFKAGRDFVISAGAGAGKTATLKLLATSTTARGAYMAFNKMIVADSAKKMPRNMEVRTVHGWSYWHGEGRRFKKRMDQRTRQRSEDIARFLGIDPFFCTYGEGVDAERKVVQPGALAGHVMKAVKRFANTADTEPGTQHFAYVDGIDKPTADGKRTYTNNDELRRTLLPALRKAWADQCDPNGQTRYEQDSHVKMWELGNPIIPARFIVVDEAQDLTGVMVSILQKNQARGVQIVAVGDAAQTIYEWRGTVSLFDEEYAEMFEGHATLTQSFRFGPEIAGVANMLLERAEADIRISGNPDLDSTIGIGTTADALLTRTNAGSVTAMFDAVARGLKCHLVGGGNEVASFANAAEELQLTGTTNHPELSCFTSWFEVQEYVRLDPQGEELKLLVDLIDEFGAAEVRDLLANQPKPEAADLVISTAHKAKGMEWDRVRIYTDFAEPGMKGDGDPRGEWRLLYVAATRAKLHLDHHGCAPIWNLTNPIEDDLTPPVRVIRTPELWDQPRPAPQPEPEAIQPAPAPQLPSPAPVAAPAPLAPIYRPEAPRRSTYVAHVDVAGRGEPKMFIGRCSTGCKHAFKTSGYLVIENHRLVGLFDEKGDRIQIPNCPEHGRRPYMKELEVGPADGTKCNASCWNAMSNYCSCPCQGTNHGSGHAPEGWTAPVAAELGQEEM